jgi:tetratricopeptide (TPR) repeat protein
MKEYPTSSTNLKQTLDNFRSSLEALQSAQPLPTAKDVLTALIARDKAQTLIADSTQDAPEALFRLIELDATLKKQAPRIAQTIKLADWRASLLPPETAWWWFLDEQETERNKHNETLQYIIAGTLLVLAIPLALEIIQRLWQGAPDRISIWGTLLTILLTASPFVKQGREIAQGLLERLPFVKPNYRAQIMITMSGIALVVLLVARLWLVPGPLTTYYNNAGITAQAAGNLSLAQQMFQRAAALNPDRVVPDYNLAEAYVNTGLGDKATQWYQTAIERDANFTPAYRGLGELYNQQGEYAKAENILLAGLSVRPGNADNVTEKVTNYELLANLGWSYWGQNKLELAQATLESALNMEAELKTLGDAHGTEYRLALPHFYLAQIYEQAGNVVQARQQWEDCLRFLDQVDWRQRERYLIAQQHLLALPDK